jgi:histidinol-phosphate aminotransferase
VWFPLGDRTADFAAAADEAGIVVRPFAGDGVRVSIGETEANDRLLEVADRFREAVLSA